MLAQCGRLLSARTPTGGQRCPRPGPGSCLAQWIPAGLRGTSRMARPAARGHVSMVAQARSRILFVEDEVANRQTLSWFFRDAGYDVLEAENGTESLRLARLGRPDLIVLDVNLPDMTGFEVCRRLKADPDTAAIDVLHISAFY